MEQKIVALTMAVSALHEHRGQCTARAMSLDTEDVNLGLARDLVNKCMNRVNTY